MQLRRLVYLRNHLMTIFFNSDLERSFNLILNLIETKKLESFVVLLKRWKRKRRSKIKMLKSLRKKEENDLCLSQFNSFLTIFLWLWAKLLLLLDQIIKMRILPKLLHQLQKKLALLLLQYSFFLTYSMLSGTT